MDRFMCFQSCDLFTWMSAVLNAAQCVGCRRWKEGKKIPITCMLLVKGAKTHNKNTLWQIRDLNLRVEKRF